MITINRTFATVACAAVALSATCLASSSDAMAKYNGFSGFGGARMGTPVVRDHRVSSVVVRDHRTPTTVSRPVVRDHRTITSRPIVRDHRTPAPAPIVRDHRNGQGGAGGVTVTSTPRPVVRDHRGEGPIVRDHRGDRPIVRDHRDPKIPPVVKPPVVKPPIANPPVKPPVADPRPSGPGVIIDPCRGDGCKPPKPDHKHPPKTWGSIIVEIAAAAPVAVDTCSAYEYRRQIRYVPGVGLKRVLVKVCVAE